MTEETSPLFQHLVAMLATSALQHLGALPGAEGQEADPEAASMTIDMLDVLAAKTRGNLSADEDKMLTEALSSLKMAFVQVQNQDAGAPMSDEAPPEAATPGEGPEIASEEAGPELEVPEAAAEEKQPKFHKKYE